MSEEKFPNGLIISVKFFYAGKLQPTKLYQVKLCYFHSVIKKYIYVYIRIGIFKDKMNVYLKRLIINTRTTVKGSFGAVQRE